ncbi:DUF1127 domain-containing protein [Bradyrhizobium sp. CCGUVB1N3]|uniref:DUF1127 domain-containing protein n=1 Tax=Bradyrhizobium sp. CCGUVB1N3 TaxID=2949629 RepID=UPI0020B42BA4|nr:DUF1127 domain-containing protein [Bradyrhizobium sp. CCGUVB1N3]MCP3477145.1 DUF1127 domain-containing protein [Bradyrhizobium sp. CCGUVB1N3]
MPPQQTNITSETERDAAALRLDLSIATLDDALSEKDAAGPTAAATGRVLSLLKRYWRAFQEQRQRQSLRATLQDLSDRELMDIGLTRGEIDYLTPERAIDTLRDGTRHLWSRGGM